MLCTFTQFHSMVTSYKIIIQHHNQDIDIDMIHQLYSDFLRVTCTRVCVCVCVYFILYSFILCVSTTTVHHKDPSGCPFITTPTFLLPSILFP